MKTLEIELEKVYSKDGVLNKEEIESYKKKSVEKLLKDTKINLPRAFSAKWQDQEIRILDKREPITRALYEKGVRKITVEYGGDFGVLTQKPIKLKDARLLTKREYDQWFAYLSI